jgi:hypothetical protein
MEISPPVASIALDNGAYVISETKYLIITMPEPPEPATLKAVVSPPTPPPPPPVFA